MSVIVVAHVVCLQSAKINLSINDTDSRTRVSSILPIWIIYISLAILSSVMDMKGALSIKNDTKENNIGTKQ